MNLEQIEAMFGVTVGSILGKTVSVISVTSEPDFYAQLLGVGDDGFGDTCIFVRQPTSVHVEGVHPSRVKLVASS